jgi:nitrite reductase/ring-hydroxylating ferredoxin subunit
MISGAGNVDRTEAAATGGARIFVANGGALAEGGYLRKDIHYAGETIAVVVFRYKGRCLAYRNLCVHMPRRLDCEKEMIFDETGRYLRCSMHGILYEPITGESISEICNGKRLTPIEVSEDGEGIWIVDRLATALTSTA